MWVQSLGQEDPLEEGMTIHSITLAWRIPWTEEPGQLWSIGSHRVRHDLSDLAAAVHCMRRPHLYWGVETWVTNSMLTF